MECPRFRGHLSASVCRPWREGCGVHATYASAVPGGVPPRGGRAVGFEWPIGARDRLGSRRDRPDAAQLAQAGRGRPPPGPDERREGGAQAAAPARAGARAGTALPGSPRQPQSALSSRRSAFPGWNASLPGRECVAVSTPAQLRDALSLPEACAAALREAASARVSAIAREDARQLRALVESV